MNRISRRALLQWLDNTLTPARFRDYCPNGLQVEGTDTVQRVVTGVTASQALLEAAVEQGADTVLVHHGWFWKNEDARVIGIKRRRLAWALAHDLNIIGYHLPLDAHPVLGNNAQLGAHLGISPDTTEEGMPQTYGEQGLIWAGSLTEPMTLAHFSQHVEHVLQRRPLWTGNPEQRIERIGWCTGGAQGYFQAALETDIDLFITGEISEPNHHIAQETGTAFMAAGHHATERYGIQALGQAMGQELGIHVSFIDIDNPA